MRINKDNLIVGSSVKIRQGINDSFFYDLYFK